MSRVSVRWPGQSVIDAEFVSTMLSTLDGNEGRLNAQDFYNPHHSSFGMGTAAELQLAARLANLGDWRAKTLLRTFLKLDLGNAADALIRYCDKGLYIPPFTLFAYGCFMWSWGRRASAKELWTRSYSPEAKAMLARVDGKINSLRGMIDNPHAVREVAIHDGDAVCLEQQGHFLQAGLIYMAYRDTWDKAKLNLIKAIKARYECAFTSLNRISDPSVEELMSLKDVNQGALIRLFRKTENLALLDEADVFHKSTIMLARNLWDEEEAERQSNEFYTNIVSLCSWCV